METSQSCKRIPESDVDASTPSSNKRLCTDLPLSSESKNAPFSRVSESDVGITEYISDHTGFNGILKERFSDFVVNEIDTEGRVVKLTNLKIPYIPKVNIDVEGTLDEETVKEIEKLKAKQIYEVKIEVTDKDKETRKKIHDSIRKKFDGVESTTEDRGDTKYIVVKRFNANRIGQRSQSLPGGNYLHFVLYKENKDTMDTINNISSFIKVPPKVFSYAGTKDKRAKTSQLVSAKRVGADKLLSINNQFTGIRIGNLEYKNENLKLGDLWGNLFTIVLRQVDGDSETIEKAMTSLETKGFINYYGLQRFGTSSVPTHAIGRCLLHGDWKGAIDLVLAPKAEDDEDLAAAKSVWFQTGNANRALQVLRRKWGAEGRLLSGLAGCAPNDLYGALGAIPRNLRLMYIHSYQSYIWNKVASKRMKEYGFAVKKGDLVTKDRNVLVDNLEDERGESDRKTLLKNLVKVITEEEVEKYSINDILLPLPGHSVVFPDNETKSWYDEFLKEDGMNWSNFDSKQKAMSLSGAYRKLIVVPENVEWEIIPYSDVTKPLILSDLDELQGRKLPQTYDENSLTALKLKFQLPPSAYATMAVREVLKRSTYYSSHASTYCSSTYYPSSSTQPPRPDFSSW